MITEKLVENILNTTYEDLPADVIEHGKKSIYNWLGVTIGAIEHESVEMALKVAKESTNTEDISLLGREDKTDLLSATFINGMSSHIFDFDDTHLDTINHPSGPVAPVIFSLAEKYNIDTRKALLAFILGCEAELRISNAVYPSHYQLGWHITSTTGVFGAAVAAGIMLDLTKEQMVYALGIAGTQSFGLREMFGTMTKPLHPGKAAQNGLYSALLAKEGFTSSKQVLEAKRGFANVLAPEHDLDKVNIDFGRVWEIKKNAFKPYACGIVLHPSIDACIQLGKYYNFDEVDRIELHVNPYVLELTGKETPQTGLEGKFSIYHTGAVAFLDSDAGEEQYSEEKIYSEKVIKMRDKIVPTVENSMSEEKVKAVLYTTSGETEEIIVENATGSIANPMTQQHLEEKFNKLVEPILGASKSNQLSEQFLGFENVNIQDILTNTK